MSETDEKHFVQKLYEAIEKICNDDLYLITAEKYYQIRHCISVNGGTRYKIVNKNGLDETKDKVEEKLYYKGKIKCEEVRYYKYESDYWIYEGDLKQNVEYILNDGVFDEKYIENKLKEHLKTCDRLKNSVPYSHLNISEKQIENCQKLFGDILTYLIYHGYSDQQFVTTDLVTCEEIKYKTNDNGEKTYNNYNLLEIKFPRLEYFWKRLDNNAAAYQPPINDNELFKNTFFKYGSQEFITDDSAGTMLVDFLRLLSVREFNKQEYKAFKDGHIIDNINLYFISFFKRSEINNISDFLENITNVLHRFISRVMTSREDRF